MRRTDELFDPVQTASAIDRRALAAPIGMFDSGVGGLTVAAEVLRALPNERVLYIADQKHVPYGGRPLDEVRALATSLSAHLFAEGAKVVVMACNISSATALEHVRARFGRDRVLGVIEAGARAAVTATRVGRVGVLATRGTVDTGAYTRTIQAALPATEAGRGITVSEVACPRFVPLVEAGDTAGPEAFDAAREYLAPILAAGADTIVLGCTHYPFLLDTLTRVAGPGVTFVDPAAATVRELAALLAADRLAATEAPVEPHLLLTTGEVSTFTSQLARFWPASRFDAGHVDWRKVEGPHP